MNRNPTTAKEAFEIRLRMLIAAECRRRKRGRYAVYAHVLQVVREMFNHDALTVDALRQALAEAIRFMPGGDLHGCCPGIRVAEWRELVKGSGKVKP